MTASIAMNRLECCAKAAQNAQYEDQIPIF
jgi:hypothetical protein